MPSTGEESLARAIVRLTDAGYKDDFRVVSEGLRAVISGCLHEPESLVIDEICTLRRRDRSRRGGCRPAATQEILKRRRCSCDAPEFIEPFCDTRR